MSVSVKHTENETTIPSKIKSQKVERKKITNLKIKVSNDYPSSERRRKELLFI